jgi:hypothetical protein
VLEDAIRDGVGKLDPAFGYADRYDPATGAYQGLSWAKGIPSLLPGSAVLVKANVVLEQLRDTTKDAFRIEPLRAPQVGVRTEASSVGFHDQPTRPTRFFGSVEIDMVRPVKSFDTILNAVIMELQRTPSTKVKLTLEIEAESAKGFDENDIGVVRDNARQLKFKPDSTGFA